MRVAIRPRLAFLLALSACLGAPSAAFAQDSWEDEFAEDNGAPRPAQTPAGGTPAAATPAGGDDDGFDDEPGTTPTPTPAAGELAPRTEAETIHHQRFVLHNTFGGAVGGLRIVDAGSGPSETFRIQLATGFFFQNGFLNPNDDNQWVGGTLSASWTPWEFLEVWAALATWANANKTETPGLFQTLGDSTLGVKGFYGITPWFTLGGDLSVTLLNTVGGVGAFGDSTSLGIRLNASADLRRLEGGGAPVILRLNLQYFLDNSGSLVRDVEQRRYNALPDPMPIANEDRHLVTQVERFALNLNRVDRFNIGLGTEFPIEALPDFFVSPILEWNLGVPINRQGYNCLYVPADPRNPAGGPVAGADGCLANQGIDAFPMTLTLGVRVLPPPPVQGLSGFLGVDIGLTGTSTFVRELAANAQYKFLLGLSYAYDTHPRPAGVRIEERVVENRVEVPAALPPKGRVRGLVVEQGALTPVAGAIIRFPGRELTALHAGDDGRFVTYEVDPGMVQLEVSHPEYNSGTCSGEIPAAGGEVEVRCELVALPRLGDVRGRIINQDNAPVPGAQVTLTGPMSRTLAAGLSGELAVTGLTPGHYSARIEAEGYLLKLTEFDVAPRGTATPEITLVARPRQATATLRGNREIVIRRQINFATDSDVVPTASEPMLAEVADIILRNPQLAKVEVQGHTDNVGNAQRNQELSQRRADSVRTWLIAAGVPADRLTAVGYGSAQPLVPPITAAARARNRRVQFIVRESAP